MFLEQQPLVQHGPVTVIAEIGVNHDGDVAKAHALVEAAADAACDVVKFQIFDPAGLVTSEGATAEYQRRLTGTRTQLEMLAALTLPDAAWGELAAHASERGLAFLATAFDEGSAALLAGLGVCAVKVPSGELTHHRFLRLLADMGLPMIISTGMADWEEVRSALDVTSHAPERALLHCVTAYPAPLDACNLNSIPFMARESGLAVGWSDHTNGSLTAIAAVALGAPLLEKHLTLDSSAPGPDHAASMEPTEMAEYVRAAKATQMAMGVLGKARAAVESPNVQAARRSPYLVGDRPAGHVVSKADVAFLRPMSGLPADDGVLGARLRRDVAAGQVLTEWDIHLSPSPT